MIGHLRSLAQTPNQAGVTRVGWVYQGSLGYQGRPGESLGYQGEGSSTTTRAFFLTVVQRQPKVCGRPIVIGRSCIAVGQMLDGRRTAVRRPLDGSWTVVRWPSDGCWTVTWTVVRRPSDDRRAVVGRPFDGYPPTASAVSVRDGHEVIPHKLHVLAVLLNLGNCVGALKGIESIPGAAACAGDSNPEEDVGIRTNSSLGDCSTTSGTEFILYCEPDYLALR